MFKKIVLLTLLVVPVLVFCGCESAMIYFGTDEDGEYYKWNVTTEGEYNGYQTFELLMDTYIEKDGLIVSSEFGNTDDWLSSDIRMLLNNDFSINSFTTTESNQMINYVSNTLVKNDAINKVRIPYRISLFAFGIDIMPSRGTTAWILDNDSTCATATRDNAAHGMYITCDVDPQSKHLIWPAFTLSRENVMMIIPDEMLGYYDSLLELTIKNGNVHRLVAKDDSMPAFNADEDSVLAVEGKDIVLHNVDAPPAESYIRCAYNNNAGSVTNTQVTMLTGKMVYDEQTRTASINFSMYDLDDDLSGLVGNTYDFNFWYEKDNAPVSPTLTAGEHKTIQVKVIEDPAIELNDATNITNNSVDLSMSITNRSETQVDETGIEVYTNSGNDGVFSINKVDSSGLDISFTATSIDTDTTYYYRAYAKNDLGTHYSEVKSFTTYKDEYTITVSYGDNGSITPETIAVGFGTDQIFDITPDAGYSVVDVVVDSVSQGAIDTYTFSDVKDDHSISAEFSADIQTIEYNSYGGAGDSTDTHATDTIFNLHNGQGFIKVNYVIDGWNIDNTNYELGALYTMPANDVTAYAVWEADSDNDGISDADEIAAGSDPNDSNDTPMVGGIEIAVDSGGTVITCVINSTPRESNTDSNGNAEFGNTSLVPHTLSLRDGTNQVGTYELNFVRGNSNYASIVDDGNNDGNGNLYIYYNSGFQSINLSYGQNANGSYRLLNTNVNAQSTSVNYMEFSNPKTGDNSQRNYLWILIIAGVLMTTGILLTIRHGHLEE